MIYEFILPFSEANLNLLPNSIKVGIDKGTIIALNNAIKLDYALGDFDSISDLEYLKVKKEIKNVIKLNPIKDETDTEYAIKMFNNPNNKIIIHGGIKGKRIEHLLANLNIVLKYDNIQFKDNETLIFKLSNRLEIDRLTYSDYKYISFFATENSIIDLKGFKYNLDNYHFNKFDNLCISNEIEAEQAIISFSGVGLVIFSKNDHDL